MSKVIIVGCGSLGSTFAEELAKRSLALTYPLEVKVCDFDKVEERNVVAQNFSPAHIGYNKADVVASNLENYSVYLDVSKSNAKITQDNYKVEFGELSEDTILVDCVDNINTRQLLWQIGVMHNIPVLHLGMSQSGSGNVSWNYKNVDTFPLSPASLSASQQKTLTEKKEDKSLAPCVLNSFRSLILNTSIAGINALFLFLGKDPANFFEEVHNGEPIKGMLSYWSTDVTSFTPNLEFTAFGE